MNEWPVRESGYLLDYLSYFTSSSQNLQPFIYDVPCDNFSVPISVSNIIFSSDDFSPNIAVILFLCIAAAPVFPAWMYSRMPRQSSCLHLPGPVARLERNERTPENLDDEEKWGKKVLCAEKVFSSLVSFRKI